MVTRLITALAAAAMLGVTTPAAARVDRGHDAVVAATLERTWSWEASGDCGEDAGSGRRAITIRTTSPVRVGRNGGTIRVVGTRELRGRAATWEERDGSCTQRVEHCAAKRQAISGLVRLTMRGDAVRLSNLRYRVVGRAGCAPPEADAVRAALPNEPRLESVVVHDRDRKLRNARIPRLVVRGSADPSARLTGAVTGTVQALVAWSVTLIRR